MVSTFLFLKLYLAHLIGDFILQFEELYQLKLRSRLGHFFHVVIHAFVSALLVMPFLESKRVWVFIGMVTTFHFFQDLIKYSLQEKYPQFRFPLFTLDQICHGLMIAVIFIFPLPIRFPEVNLPEPFRAVYLDNISTLYMIAFFLTTFGGSYFLHSFRTNYCAGTRHDHFISNFEIIHSFLERTWITGFFLFSTSPIFYIFAPLIGLLRIGSRRLRSIKDFVLSFIFAAAIGLVFRMWI